MRGVVALVAAAGFVIWPIHAFLPPHAHSSTSISFSRLSTAQDDDTATLEPASEDPNATPLCFWRNPTNWGWEPRINFDDLAVGQELTGIVFQDLLKAKTGPKIWFDCGVGLVDTKHNKWQIVTGMYRLQERKPTAAVKKTARLRKKSSVQVWVSRIYPSNHRFEVVLDETKVPASKELISASSLEVGQELVGTVIRVENYGVMVNVGANRYGLLHIQKVADLYGKYIDKAKGLAEAGLEKGARIRVAVSSNEKKRLFLDFTADVKQEAEQERAGTEAVGLSQDEAAEWAEFAAAAPTTATEQPVARASSDDAYEISEDEAAAWAAYGSGEDTEDEEVDEDRDIEDSLGIGMY